MHILYHNLVTFLERWVALKRAVELVALKRTVVLVALKRAVKLWLPRYVNSLLAPEPCYNGKAQRR